MRIAMAHSRAAVAAVALAVLLTGCGAGQAAQTAAQATNSGGANGQVGQIHVEDAQITYAGPVPEPEVYLPGEDAALQVTIVNTGDGADRLIGVSSPVATSVRVVGETRMPGGQTLTAGYEDPAASITLPYANAIDITLVGLTTRLRAGLTYPVTFTFERAGEISLDVPIENPEVLPPRARGGEPTDAGQLDPAPTGRPS